MKKILLIAFAAIISSCNFNQNQSNNQKVSIREEWFPSACYAGDMMAVNITGKKNNLDIIVESGAEDIDPVKLVISGKNDFGVAGADRVINANEKGANLVVIGVINYKTPTCFLTLKKNNITNAKGFENHIAGVMTGNNTEYVYRSLVDKAKLDKSKIKEVEAPFDLVTFINGTYDIRPAFAYDEPVSLDMQGIEYNTIKPEDYGVNFIGPVLFCKGSTVKDKNKIVQSFINAMCEGWQLALSEPQDAIKKLKVFDKTINTDRELKSLEKGKEYFNGENNKPLYLSLNRWDLFINELLAVKLIANNSNAKDCIDMSFVENYYNKK